MSFFILLYSLIFHLILLQISLLFYQYHNRNLHISALFNNRKVDIGSEKVDIQDKKVDIESVLSEKGKDFSRIVFLLNFLLHI